jgi:hypothetical protein
MESSIRLTMADLTNHLRSKLLEAKADKNKELIEDLHITINTIFQAAEIKKDKTLTLLLDRLLEAVGDYIMDDDWKSDIPSEEEINNHLNY